MEKLWVTRHLEAFERPLSRLIALAAALALATGSIAVAGCSKQDQNDARNTTNEAVAEVKQQAKEVRKEASQTLDQAKVAARDLAQDAKVAGKGAGDQLSHEVADTVITTGVKAELAKDASLSALQVDVSTDAGRVALHGTAPSDDARKHASALARSVKGVVSVDNALTVAPAK